jgi:hypothetical protein
MYSQGCGGSSPFDGTKSFRSVRVPRTMRDFCVPGDVVFGVTIRARSWAVRVSPRYVSFAPSGLMLLFSRRIPDLAVWAAFLRRFAACHSEAISVVWAGNSRFLHYAVAVAPTPVGMTGVLFGMTKALVGMTKFRECARVRSFNFSG